MDRPTLAAIRGAHERIRAHTVHTPVLTSPWLDERLGARLYFKCENLQRVGAFKFRGAANAVFSLPEAEAARGVATHSSGNHAAALALAGRLRGLAVHVVMPRSAPAVKQNAVRELGAEITLCQPTLQAREDTLRQVLERTSAVPIHPYNDARIIAGQGTAALELLEAVPDLDVVIAPVGGGGLLSGTAIASKGLRPGIQVFGAEPANADDAWQSRRAGRIIPVGKAETIADGLRTSLGDQTFPVIHELVADILLASEDEIVAACRMLFERLKVVVEPSGAVPLAALLSHGERVAGKRVGMILSGGNVDPERLPWLTARE